jgi:hypothetical protein
VIEVESLPCLKEDYPTGWVCALRVELAAAAEMLDEEHEAIPPASNDNNMYTLGRIGDHNVVIPCVPKGGRISDEVYLYISPLGLDGQHWRRSPE